MKIISFSRSRGLIFSCAVVYEWKVPSALFQVYPRVFFAEIFLLFLIKIISR
jgi:hypothetical protein